MASIEFTQDLCDELSDADEEILDAFTEGWPWLSKRYRRVLVRNSRTYA